MSRLASAIYQSARPSLCGQWVFALGPAGLPALVLDVRPDDWIEVLVGLLIRLLGRTSGGRIQAG
jgi:hypothetical protein